VCLYTLHGHSAAVSALTLQQVSTNFSVYLCVVDSHCFVVELEFLTFCLVYH